jgi:hypothetical protein
VCSFVSVRNCVWVCVRESVLMSQCKLWPLLSLKLQFPSYPLRGRDQYSAFSSSISCVSSFVSVSCVYPLVFVCLFFCLTVLETTLSLVVSVSVIDFAGW